MTTMTDQHDTGAELAEDIDAARDEPVTITCSGGITARKPGAGA